MSDWIKTSIRSRKEGNGHFLTWDMLCSAHYVIYEIPFQGPCSTDFIFGENILCARLNIQTRLCIYEELIPRVLAGGKKIVCSCLIAFKTSVPVTHAFCFLHFPFVSPVDVHIFISDVKQEH